MTSGIHCYAEVVPGPRAGKAPVLQDASSAQGNVKYSASDTAKRDGEADDASERAAGEKPLYQAPHAVHPALLSKALLGGDDGGIAACTKLITQGFPLEEVRRNQSHAPVCLPAITLNAFVWMGSANYPPGY